MVCSECNGKVSTDALACPHCGSRRNQVSWGRVLLGVLFFLFIVFLVLGTGRSGNGKKTTDPYANQYEADQPGRKNSSMAYIMMEGFVKDRIKTPATAQFPGVFDGRLDHVKPLGNEQYKINSWFDSQNTFGATVRTRFIGTVRQVDDKNWELLSLHFDDR